MNDGVVSACPVPGYNVHYSRLLREAFTSVLLNMQIIAFKLSQKCFLETAFPDTPVTGCSQASRITECIVSSML